MNDPDFCPVCAKRYAYVLPDYDTNENIFYHENAWEMYVCRVSRAEARREEQEVDCGRL